MTPLIIKRACLAFALFILSFANSYAQEIRIPEKPSSADYYVDLVELISVEDREAINATASALLREEKVALYVVVIPSLAEFGAGNYSIANYTKRVFDSWGIGFTDRNYGMLLLIAKDDRRARIELGSDWSHDYDVDAQRVMDTLIIPQFKRDEFSGGIMSGVEGMDAMARGLELPKAKQPWWVIPAFVLGILLIIAVIVSLFKSGRSGWGWALIAGLAIVIFFVLRTSIANAGSGGGFGGGSSGGGGASGGW